MHTRLLIIGVALGLLALTGCRYRYNLKVTEVGKREVELHMDEPSTKTVNLRGFDLSWAGHGGYSNQVSLSTLGRDLQGGEFLIIWERGGYSGPPVAEEFSGGQQGRVPGIKVAWGFFDQIGNVPSEVRVWGERSALAASHRVDDVVRFGTPLADRPNTGGSFSSDGSLGNPTGSLSLQRSWGTTGPTDTGVEADWARKLESWGVSTP
ncbi:MAG: hypothetical protein ACYSX0_19675 [Planctomycetota bacterium]|jgi:hypothetical protein